MKYMKIDKQIEYHLKSVMMRFILLIFQSALLLTALISPLTAVADDDQMAIMLPFKLVILGISNYFLSTVLKFSPLKCKKLINIHWFSATVYLITLGLAFLYRDRVEYHHLSNSIVWNPMVISHSVLVYSLFILQRKNLKHRQHP